MLRVMAVASSCKSMPFTKAFLPNFLLMDSAACWIRLSLQTWGIPGWKGGLMINARAETVCEKPMFRRSMAAQRCVIPATSFYEWDAARHKYQFALPGEPLYLAGLYDNVDGANRFVILTTTPNASMHGIHDRMPLILRRDQIRPWLTDAESALHLLAAPPPLLERHSTDGQMSFGDLL